MPWKNQSSLEVGRPSAKARAALSNSSASTMGSWNESVPALAKKYRARTASATAATMATSRGRVLGALSFMSVHDHREALDLDRARRDQGLLDAPRFHGSSPENAALAVIATTRFHAIASSRQLNGLFKASDQVPTTRGPA